MVDVVGMHIGHSYHGMEYWTMAFSDLSSF